MRNVRFRRHNDLQRCISERELETFGAQRKDHKFLGCSKDLLKKVNEQCSLKSSCEMKVVDLENKEETFCYMGLKKYLSVDYSCIKSRNFYEN